MLELGVQTQNIIEDENPLVGFRKLREAGFTCCDFSLNGYWKNRKIYEGDWNPFFEQTVGELEAFFAPQKEAAALAGVRFHQMHMPYPILVPDGKARLNTYLWNQVAPKSMVIGRFLGCKYIVVHGFRLKDKLGSEKAEWEKTEEFLDFLAPIAKEYGMTICLENLYGGNEYRKLEGPCCNAKLAAERIDMLNEKHGAELFGFCFDTGHAKLVNLDIESFVTTLGSRLKVLHIHDNDGIGDLHQMPFCFTKTRENKPSMDWEGFYRGLAEINFDGVLSFETAPVLKSFPPELKDDALQMIAKIGKYMAEQVEGLRI
ncbi:MAG: sugar phosphate isomerase/epimerase [Lachnospiraceae bacterium]|jgi:sugar phosphate isomerase/epimerase|nr:sugar phosphate isomerase/epimerase [Lachnospiraceae bacterium]